MKRTIAFLLTAILLLGLCGIGCVNDPTDAMTIAEPTAEPDPASTEPPAAVPTESAEDPNGIPVRWRNGGTLSFLPHEPLSVPKLSEMVYTRPDAEALIAQIKALTEKVPEYTDAASFLNEYYDIAQDIHHFETMSDLALFRFCMHSYDREIIEEYDYCDEQSAIVKEKQSALYAACAASPYRDALEQAYFGEGFFADYDGYQAADEGFYALIKQENDLLFRYYQQSNKVDYSSYYEIKQNHDVIGNLYIELAKVRRQIAEAKGYENYMEYSYACTHQRDYTPAQARAFLEQVKAQLVPLMEHTQIAEEFATYSDWYSSDSMKMLSAAAERMGGPVWESCRFLTGCELYDISSAPNKQGVGYTSYLGDYEAPYIFIDPDSKDLLVTLFHEFGHFADFYVNYGIMTDLETAETYSQAMQYLAFAYAEPFTEEERTENLRATLSNLLVYSILREGAFADFELQVYALAPEELTLDRIDAIYGQCMEDYGLSRLSGAQFRSIYWVAYGHFFSQAGYVISYAVSAVSAMQIARMEAENPGAGVAAFCRLLNRTHGKKFSIVLEEAGLDSPFAPETLERTAEFLKDAFDLP